MVKHRDWSSRATDYAWYIGIGLSVVGFTMLVAIYFPGTDLGAQLVTVFLGACVIVAYMISALWKRKDRQFLVIYCGAIVIVHFAIWLVAYRSSGRTGAYVAGFGMVLEMALFLTVAEKLIPDNRNRHKRTS